MAAADRHERLRVLAQGERLRARRGKEGAGHLGVVVVLGRHPEQGHGAPAAPRQRLGPPDAGRGLGQGEQRARPQAALLTRDDDQGRRVGKSFGEGGGARVFVARVGLGKGRGDGSAVGRRTGRRPYLVLLAGQDEPQRLEQVEVPAVKKTSRQIAEQAAGAEVGTARSGAGGATRHGGRSYRRPGNVSGFTAEA